MSEFLQDFNVFVAFFVQALSILWQWFFTSILGKVILFLMIISVFLYILTKLIELGD